MEGENQELSDEKRAVGNARFKAGKWAAAASYYGDAAACCPLKTRHVPLCNRALAHLKLGSAEACVLDCDRALELCPGFHKAMYRRALARRSLDVFDLALADLRACLATPGGPSGMDAMVRAAADEIESLIAGKRPTIFVGGVHGAASDVELRRGLARALVACQWRRDRLAAVAAGGEAGGAGADEASDFAVVAADEATTPDFAVYALELRTRYYTTTVELWVHTAGIDGALASFPPHALARLEGIVLVDDVVQSGGDAGTALERAQSFVQHVTHTAPILKQCSAELQICVACGPDLAAAAAAGGEQRPAKAAAPFDLGQAEEEPDAPDVLTQDARSAIVEWCVDDGYELVEARVLVGEKDPASAEAWLMADSEITSRDKAGVPRILEALESTMWSTLVQRHPVLQQAAAAVASGGAESASASATEGAGCASAAPAAAAAAAPAEEADDDVPPADFDPTKDVDLNVMIERAREVRRRGEGMSDEERREFAATAALELAAQLGM